MLIPIKVSVHLQFQTIQPDCPSRILPEGRRKDHGIVNPPTMESITQGKTQDAVGTFAGISFCPELKMQIVCCNLLLSHQRGSRGVGLM